MDISIHALLAESDQQKVDRLYQAIEFLSTLSLRRATGAVAQPVLVDVKFLSTLSLRRATLRSYPYRRFLTHFYPRSPCGERQWYSANLAQEVAISIHALLAESDVLADLIY